jgi:hypothetical protein
MRSEHNYAATQAESAPPDSLTRRKEQAIAALLAHQTLADAARECKISERTLRRWLKNKSFYSRYRRERDMMLDGVVDVLKQSAVGAVRTLVAVAENKKSPASARVSAASRILELNFRSHDLITIEKRLSSLEELARSRP